MRHTLKAVFENRSDAQHVLEELIASGYTHAEHAEHDEGFGSSVKHAVSRLFGSKHHEAAVDSTTQVQSDDQHGRHIVMFTTGSEPEAERAAGIIGRFGPTGIEEHHEQEQEHADASGDGEDAYVSGFASMGTYPPGTEPGSLQYRTIDDGRYFGTQYAISPPSGNTYQDSMGRTPWGRPDETMAYHYGRDMGASEAYADSTWDEAAASLEEEWERKYAGHRIAAWHRIQDAVRHGWEKVRAHKPR